jgi:hypothetical protein
MLYESDLAVRQWDRDEEYLNTTIVTGNGAPGKILRARRLSVDVMAEEAHAFDVPFVGRLEIP